jgi:Tol biopolymer transport system component
MGEKRTARPLLQDRFDQHSREISPNGRWMAYVSEESGRAEVFVPEFPGLGQRTQISSNGGNTPRWSRDGVELFYKESPKKLLSIPLRTDPALTVSKATAALTTRTAST